MTGGTWVTRVKETLCILVVCHTGTRGKANTHGRIETDEAERKETVGKVHGPSGL